MAIKAEVTKQGVRGNKCPIATARITEQVYNEVKANLSKMGLFPSVTPNHHLDWLSWAYNGDVDAGEAIKAINGGNRAKMYDQAFRSGVRGPRGNKDLAALTWSDKMRQEQRASGTSLPAFFKMPEAKQVEHLTACGINAKVS